MSRLQYGFSTYIVGLSRDDLNLHHWLVEGQRKAGEHALPNEVICREQIQSGEMIPSILITNYAMLEYLLLRPKDTPLFTSGAWRFLVLDEAHTYVGAKGIEISHLIRRLKHRLRHQLGETRCIATSATLGVDDISTSVQFAKALFGEPFESGDIILGEPEPEDITDAANPIDPSIYLDARFAELLHKLPTEDPHAAKLLAERLHDLGLSGSDLNVEAADIPALLWETMRHLPEIHKLRTGLFQQLDRPLLIQQVADELFPNTPPFDDPTNRQDALYQLINLGTIARRTSGSASLLPARYHLFARAPQGMWVCLNPQCAGRITPPDVGWSRVFSTPHKVCDACGGSTYEVVICRTCGQPYVRTFYDNRRHMLLGEDESGIGAYTTHYFTWKPIQEDRALSDLPEDDQEIPPSSVTSPAPTNLFQSEIQRLCLRCQRDSDRCNCDSALLVDLYRVNKVEKDNQNRERTEPFTFMNECARCRGSSIKDTEIATPVSMKGTAPLAMVVQELYRNLPASSEESASKLPGEGRKLLSFYDSRQGAARFAASLQDSVNSQGLRHLIVHSVDSLVIERGFSPSFQSVVERVAQCAWEEGFFHNFWEGDEPPARRNTPYDRLGRDEQRRLQEKVLPNIVAEFSTRRRERNSLENLGMIGVQYDELETPLPFETLASRLSLDVGQTRSLVQYLLDDLRNTKIITLPQGVTLDDPAFGRDTVKHYLVRSNARPNSGETPWVGQTPRQGRRRLTAKLLAHWGQPTSDDAVKNTLDHIWSWFQDECSLLEGTPSQGYQLWREKLLFSRPEVVCRCDTCQRLNYRAAGLPCAHLDCNGTLRPVEDLAFVQKNNFYYQFFNQPPVPMRVEEHTAQLNSEKGTEYQEAFKKGEINVLSCSTTFEMGVDLGDLQSIVMSNIPPLIANYRQRAGRAGRRASTAAFILSWASDRPHDQTYFEEPTRIISGKIRPPYIELENPLIRQRHINALLLGNFLRYRAEHNAHGTRVGDLFDPHLANGSHYEALDSWRLAREEHLLIELAEMATALEITENIQSVAAQWLNAFVGDLRDKARSHYEDRTTFYRERMEELKELQNQRFEDNRADEQKRINGLLKRVNEEDLIDFLSSRGVLPSYSFPLNTVELLVPSEYQLRLQRDLSQAIRDYAPGNEVVADKRIWRSGGLALFKKAPQRFAYTICPHCKHLEIADTPGQELPNHSCRICGDRLSTGHPKSFLVPDGFKVDEKKSGKLAGQYSSVQSNLTQTAIVPRSGLTEEQCGALLFLAYEPNGELLHVNAGESGQGFKLCFSCGKQIERGRHMCGNSPSPNPTEQHVVALGFRQRTNTLHLRFSSAPYVTLPSAGDTPFWLTLMFALVQGAHRALQIERGDIDGVLLPRENDGGWEQTIVLYDNVPGGAGHVKRIQDAIAVVVEAALGVVNCTQCAPETSCYNCLRDYNNQFNHAQLQRGKVIPFLEALRNDLVGKKNTRILGEGMVVAINTPRWLMQQISTARQDIYLAVNNITTEIPNGETRTWLDVLQDLIQRGVKVNLWLKNPPSPTRGDPDSFGVAHHLIHLLDSPDYFHVKHTDSRLEWQFLIDPESDSGAARAIRSTNDAPLALGENHNPLELSTTTHPVGIASVKSIFDELSGTPITPQKLQPPPRIRVITLPRPNQPSDDEQTLFGDVFAASPVRKLEVNDRYLYDESRIVHRLGAYVRMAMEGGALEQVRVLTGRAGRHHVPGTPQTQDNSFATLCTKTGLDPAKLEKHYQAEHDRHILLTRIDGTQVRIMIGKGLDFIRPNGQIERTTVVIEDPYIP